jgi:hypothetical protein
MRPSANRIVEPLLADNWAERDPNPDYAVLKITSAILSRIAQLHKWRSSLRPDDKCHPMPHITITTASATRKLRRDSLEPAFIGGRSVQSGN